VPACLPAWLQLYKDVPSLADLPAAAGEEIVLNACLNSKVGCGWRRGWEEGENLSSCHYHHALLCCA
jgi:hypothetical protein